MERVRERVQVRYLRCGDFLSHGPNDSSLRSVSDANESGTNSRHICCLARENVPRSSQPPARRPCAPSLPPAVHVASRLRASRRFPASRRQSTTTPAPLNAEGHAPLISPSQTRSEGRVRANATRGCGRSATTQRTPAFRQAHAPPTPLPAASVHCDSHVVRRRRRCSGRRAASP